MEFVKFLAEPTKKMSPKDNIDTIKCNYYIRQTERMARNYNDKNEINNSHELISLSN
jgi:hypothetical protein